MACQRRRTTLGSLSLRRGFDNHRFAGISEKGVTVSVKSAQPTDAAAVEEDLVAIGQFLVGEWLREREQEREFIRRESEVQTALARRRWRELFGSQAGWPAEPTATQVKLPLPEPPSQKMVARKALKPRVPRPGLAKMVEREWATPEGKRFLASATMRDLADYFRINSHSSFYGIPLFNEKIRPLREKGQTAQSAGAWMERNARDRHR